MELSAETVVSRAPDAVFERLDGRILVLDPDHGRYVRLNGTGSELWTALEEPAPIGQLVDLLLATARPVERERAHADVAAFVDFLRERGLVRCTA